MGEGAGDCGFRKSRVHKLPGSQSPAQSPLQQYNRYLLEYSGSKNPESYSSSSRSMDTHDPSEGRVLLLNKFIPQMVFGSFDSPKPKAKANKSSSI
jgi:hypothetical protein